MLSFTSPKPISIFPSHHSRTSHLLTRHPRNLNLHSHHHTTKLKPIPASSLPPSPTPYQPFRPPPSSSPSLPDSPDAILETLRDRLGLWFNYAPLIPVLSNQYGFSPSAIEEATGITGVDQNRFVVAAKVRESLTSALDEETLSFFDSGGAALLYELRLLSNAQRAAAARLLVKDNLDGGGARELARAIKDFPRRRGDPGWDDFNYTSPGDCLAFMHFRQSREYRTPAEIQPWLERAALVAETDLAKGRIASELRKLLAGEGEGEDPVKDTARVPVVRLKMGEVAESSRVVVLPVCDANERDIAVAPQCEVQGEFGVVVGEKEWRKWVVLPGWEPLVKAGPAVVAVSFADARVLPWRTNRWYKEEAIMVVADRGRREVEGDDGFYLVSGESGSLEVERGSMLKEKGVSEGLGTVVLVARPPKDEEDSQLADEDWD